MSRPAAVLLNLDGTLLDSEPLIAELLVRLGGPAPAGVGAAG